MLKTLLYGTLGIVGVIAALMSPLAGAVAVIEAYMMNPVVFSPDLVTVRFQFAVTAAFLFGLLLHQPKGVAKVGSEGRLILVLCAFALLAVTSSLWAVMSSRVAYASAINLCKTILVACLIPLAIENERGMRIVLWACVIGAAHAAFMHVVGGNLEYIEAWRLEEFGILPDGQASVMVFFLPAVVMLAVYAEKVSWRILCWLAVPIVIDSVVNTYQRAYFVALAAEAVCFLIFLPKRIVIRLLPLGIVAVLLFVFVFTPPTYWDWMNTITDYENEGSASSRIVLLKASLQMFSDHPIGVGYDNYSLVSYRYLDPSFVQRDRSGRATKAGHNSFTMVACETGVFGIALYLLSFGGAWWLLRMVRKRSREGSISEIEAFAMGLEIGLIGWAAGGMFHSDHEMDPAFWAVGFAVVLTRLQYWQQEELELERVELAATADDDSETKPLTVSSC
jgi:hypothetical protein